MINKILIIFFLSISSAFAQTEINWQTLKDVTFTDKYSEEVEEYFYYPHFGDKIKALAGKKVYIRGYVLVLDAQTDFYILSSNPYASCFFCGSGGPESIVELKLKPGHRKFRMDEVVTFVGKLVLNRDDIYQCNYILDKAEVFEE